MYVMMDLSGILAHECECGKWCDVGEYLDYANCKCRKKWLTVKLKNVVKILMEMKLFINDHGKVSILVQYTQSN